MFPIGTFSRKIGLGYERSGYPSAVAGATILKKIPRVFKNSERYRDF